MSDRVLLVMSSLLSAFCAQAELCWPEPTREMRPWVYNWWHGSAVDRAGLERQAEDLERVPVRLREEIISVLTTTELKSPCSANLAAGALFFSSAARADILHSKRNKKGY